jgi:hypothetical protein
MRLIGLAVILAIGFPLAPLAVNAQQPAGKVWRIGILFQTTDNNYRQAILQGAFAGFSVRPSINARGEVAFIAILDTGEVGIFTGPDPVADKVIASGDSLSGLLVTFVNAFSQSLNDHGQIAFVASFADGTSGIYVATPVP